MASVTAICADTATPATRNQADRLRALALAALVENDTVATRIVPVDTLVAAAAVLATVPTLERA